MPSFWAWGRGNCCWGKSCHNFCLLFADERCLLLTVHNVPQSSCSPSSHGNTARKLPFWRHKTRATSIETLCEIQSQLGFRQHLPGISAFQWVSRTSSPLVQWNVPGCFTSERPIQKYFSERSPTRLVRKACSYLWRRICNQFFRIIFNFLYIKTKLMACHRTVLFLLKYRA